MIEPSFAHGLLGTTLDGRYRLDAVLGEGGMGAVFRATHVALDRRVAVKLLKPHLTDDKLALERFSREARVTLRVDSAHAVKLLDFGITPASDYYMVLEYLDGRTVQREIEIDGPFAPARVAHIARQALHALGAAHAIGLIHRDVKPENLLLMRSGSDSDYTKVLDFGVAKLMQGAGDPAQLALTADGMVFGTPEFMSPEQACGLPLDGRSDLYSLAVTLFVMLTGTPLFEATTPIQWLTHHARTPPPHLASARAELAAFPELDELLQRCLAKQRDRRPATAAELAGLLARLAPSLARAAPDGPRTPSQSTRRASSYVPALRDGAFAPPIGLAPTAPAHRPPAIAPTESPPGVPRAPAPRRWVWWAGGIAVASLTGLAVGLVVQHAPSRSTSITMNATAPAAPSVAGAPATAVGSPAAQLPATSVGSSATPRAPVAHSPDIAANLVGRPAAPSANAGPAVARSTDRHRVDPDPHDATRGGVNAPVQPARPPEGGRELPLRNDVEQHLRAAEDALRTGNPLRQLAEADLALRADPRSARARFLLGDALIKSGDLDHGCKYLAEAAPLAAARARARAAGCPGD